jgi:hypothetical protein
MANEASGDALGRAVHADFRRHFEAFYATFCDELEVAESIDMFHLTREDWNPLDVAVFAVAYVAFVYRSWALQRAGNANGVSQAVEVEAAQALAAVLGAGGPGLDETAARRRLAQATDELLKMHAGKAAPYSHGHDEIVHLCTQLLRPERRDKAPIIAMMPFLQIYVPERAAQIWQAMDSQNERERLPRPAT